MSIEPSPTVLVTASRDAVQDVWGSRAPFHGSWPVRVDHRAIDTVERWVQSVCTLCSVGCALDVGVKGERIVAVRGRAFDVTNHGRLGPKGMHGFEANASGDRLRHPLIRRDGKLRDATWDEAMELLVARTKEIKERHGPGAIAFYNSGQLLLEEYYTLAIIGDAGVGTRHMDGNTRLCTATATQALCESFGTDGQPGTFADVDVTDALFHVGHNPAFTQTVLWSRILDRLAGPRRPQLVVVDPRRTATAAVSDVHLAPRLGTNLALLNGLLHVLIDRGWFDGAYVAAHTVGWASLERTVARWPLARTASVTGVPVRKLEAAAEILGTTPRLVSTVLQGVYQSNQATASAVQVNNLHLIRGLIGKPGSTVFQMNGQPSSQNTRECGANGELVAFRNFANPAHVRELAKIWNVDESFIPHGVPPTHAMQIFRLVEQGAVRMLWILGTNPGVSLPELARVRTLLEKPFLVVNDAFLNETTEHADLVLPTALWGEKTGTMTNSDRTVHLLCKAVDPPGEARSDLEILLEFARRMEFRDKDGAPLVKWRDAQGAFEAWKKCSRGQPCDYSGLSYDRLKGSGIPWPCTSEHPDGAARLYTDGVFNTATERCETFGHDLETGAMLTREQHEELAPNGRAILKAADYRPPVEEPDEAYPLWLTTGRVVHHWHTRTKTGRSQELNDAAPEPVLEIGLDDAERLDVADGDRVEIASRRGKVEARARIAEMAPGVVFLPFHYGTWDVGGEPRAANELTLTAWDPVSKQPTFKLAAVRVRRIGERR